MPQPIKAPAAVPAGIAPHTSKLATAAAPMPTVAAAPKIDKPAA